MKTSAPRLVLLPVVVALSAASCSGSLSTTPSGGSDQAQRNGEQIAAERETFRPQNDVEGANYNRRQELADDPTTILWCTASFSNPSSDLFTVPVVGKLTSGNKRPYSTSKAVIDTNTPGREYSPEVPGPDGFFGSSGEYRYGFTPADFYVDYYNLETFCTTEPMVWQRQETTIVMQPDPALLAAHEAARDALSSGDPDAAYELLDEALSDISKPAPTAAEATEGSSNDDD